MATVAYVVLLTLAGLLITISMWVPAIICCVLAFGLAGRFELRWCSDRARGAAPRPVPGPRKHL